MNRRRGNIAKTNYDVEMKTTTTSKGVKIHERTDWLAITRETERAPKHKPLELFDYYIRVIVLFHKTIRRRR